MVPDTEPNPERRSKIKYIVIGAASLLVVLFIFCLISFLWAKSFDGRLPPNVSIGALSIGGMKPEAARQTLQKKIDDILTAGVEVTLDNDKKVLTLATVISADLVEDVGFDLDGALTELMTLHSHNEFFDSWAMFKNIVLGEQTKISIKINREKIREQVIDLFQGKETLSRDASFEFTNTPEGWTIAVISAQNGRELQWDQFFGILESQLSTLTPGEIPLHLKYVEPAIDEQSAIRQVARAMDALAHAPFVVTFAKENQIWEMTDQNLSKILTPGKNDALVFQEEAFQTWVIQITNVIDRQAQDARLEMLNDRVIDFAGSTNGREVDVKLLKDELLSRVRGQSEGTIEVTIDTIEPRIKTGEVNGLGITQVLGVGTSNYRGSPMNRRANIQNGVNLLNGILIAPGDTFSLLSALAPFTSENGYLPELVIKGAKITPEIGGGLCQIGTTTFRATMNSGLPIVERRNHSIVVSYYNDPANGNPGTDATIYEPAPDFKFTNDTQHHILFQAENQTDSQELRFTFWGTSDGRTGTYSAPEVLRWIPVGEDVKVETTGLEPGEETCQASHIGADTTFKYTIVKPDGSVEQTEFPSHYRPLPKTCLIGVEKVEEEKVEENETESEKGEESLGG
jgi:vancomycin resistance protein YoaR